MPCLWQVSLDMHEQVQNGNIDKKNQGASSALRTWLQPLATVHQENEIGKSKRFHFSSWMLSDTGCYV